MIEPGNSFKEKSNYFPAFKIPSEMILYSKSMLKYKLIYFDIIINFVKYEGYIFFLNALQE